MERIITQQEIERAQQIYLAETKPYIDRLNQIFRNDIPKMLVTEKDTKVFYEETEETKGLREKISQSLTCIKKDLELGRF